VSGSFRETVQTCFTFPLTPSLPLWERSLPSRTSPLVLLNVPLSRSLSPSEGERVSAGRERGTFGEREHLLSCGRKPPRQAKSRMVNWAPSPWGEGRVRGKVAHTFPCAQGLPVTPIRLATWPRRILVNPRGFTLIELLVVIGIIGILAGMLMPSLVRAKQKANAVKCLNHLRQLELSLTMYGDEHNGEFPLRRREPTHWVSTLKPYYVEPAVLKCPSDRFGQDRSYIINGWNDYFQSTLAAEDYQAFTNWSWPHGMKSACIPNPAETITFGEKKSTSRHVHMDFSQGRGNDIEQVEQGRHGGGGPESGGSNFAFADGSIRFLRYGHSLKPVNLWAVTEEWRNATAKLP